MARRENVILLIVLASLGVSACGQSRDKRMIDECERWILAKLSAPSAYKRIDVTVGIPDAKTERQSIYISYDAPNAFNVPIRQTQICEFPYGEPEQRERPLTAIERKIVTERSADENEQVETDCCMK